MHINKGKTMENINLVKFAEARLLRPPFNNFCILITAILDKWKRAALRLDSNFSEQKMKRPPENSCKSILRQLIERKFQEPLASSRLCRLGLDPSKLASQLY